MLNFFESGSNLKNWHFNLSSISGHQIFRYLFLTFYFSVLFFH